MTSLADFDPTLRGRDFDLGRVEVTRQMVDSYREAVGETDIEDTDAAPLTLPTILIAPGAFPRIGLKHTGSHVLATWHLESRGVIRVGDAIAISMRLEDVYSKTGRSGSMIIVVWNATFTNQRGEIVAVARKSYITRPVEG